MTEATSPASRSLGITVLAVLAILYTLSIARDFLLPIAVAVILDFLLSPIIRTLKRAHIPEPLGAALVILSLLGAVGAGAYSLAEPARAGFDPLRTGCGPAKCPSRAACHQQKLKAAQTSSQCRRMAVSPRTWKSAQPSSPFTDL